MATLAPCAVACGGAGTAATDASTFDAHVIADEGSSPDDGSALDDGSSADDGTQADGGSSANAVGGPCPASPPGVGTACDGSAACGETLACEYWEGPQLAQNVVARCQQGSWYLPPFHTLGDASSPQAGDAGCPPSYAAAETTTPSCATPLCSYPEGTCVCLVFDPATPGADATTGWSCTSPGLPAGCPPTLGAAQTSPSCPGAGPRACTREERASATPPASRGRASCRPMAVQRRVPCSGRPATLPCTSNAATGLTPATMGRSIAPAGACGQGLTLSRLRASDRQRERIQGRATATCTVMKLTPK